MIDLPSLGRLMYLWDFVDHPSLSYYLVDISFRCQ